MNYGWTTAQVILQDFFPYRLSALPESSVGYRAFSRYRRPFYIVMVFCVLMIRTLPAQQLVVKQFGAKDSLVSYTPHSIIASTVSANKIIASSSVDMSERIKVIVKFTTPSRLKSRKHPGDASLQNQSAIQKISSVAPTASITRQYTESFSGIAAEVSREELELIQSLPGVARIVQDAPVRAFSAGSSDAFTPAARDNVSVTGRGIRVGVIDTGIDYTHEALGGAIGVVVVGGYDFVNNDADPMDDNGHGTHVAGIIAGNSSTLYGKAPGVKLYAYKVLDASGVGLTSTVLAGLEQAIKDSMSVINMSLGSSVGDPSDPLCEAVDRAVEAGIVVVVAAGNSGENGSIGSPAAAELALTVGAVDASNAIASFSSKGPTNLTYGIKPDVVAPGVSILSAKLGGGYVLMSGTSMAAPYAAGLAAALREFHPDWSAADIRDAIVGSALDLGQSIFAQGAGRIDTTCMFTRTALAAPALLTFGFDVSKEQHWIMRDTVLVTNRSTSARSYTFVSSSSNTGFALAFSPVALSVPAMGSATLIAELSVDNAATPNNSSLSGGYTGNITARSQDDTLQIPYVFFKGNLLQLTFSETPFQVLVHNQKGKSYSITPQSASLSIAVPEDTYDVITTFFGPRFVIREDILLRGATAVSISKDEAMQSVAIEPCDESGKILTPATGTTYSYLEAVTHKTSGVCQLMMGGGSVMRANLKQERFFSPMSSRYAYGYGINVQYGNVKSYTFDAAIDSGIAVPQKIHFVPSDLKHIDFRYDVDSTVAKIFPIVWSAFVAGSNVIGISYYNGSDAPLRYPFIQQSYYSKKPSSSFPILHYREAYKF